MSTGRSKGIASKSAPAKIYVPPAAPQRRPTLPSIEPPPLTLSPSRPITKHRTIARSLTDSPAFLMEESFNRSTHHSSHLSHSSQSSHSSSSHSQTNNQRKNKKLIQIREGEKLMDTSLSSSPTCLSLLTELSLYDNNHDNNDNKSLNSLSSDGLKNEKGEIQKLEKFENQLQFDMD